MPSLSKTCLPFIVYSTDSSWTYCLLSKVEHNKQTRRAPLSCAKRAQEAPSNARFARSSVATPASIVHRLAAVFDLTQSGSEASLTPAGVRLLVQNAAVKSFLIHCCSDVVIGTTPVNTTTPRRAVLRPDWTFGPLPMKQRRGGPPSGHDQGELSTESRLLGEITRYLHPYQPPLLGTTGPAWRGPMHWWLGPTPGCSPPVASSTVHP